MSLAAVSAPVQSYGYWAVCGAVGLEALGVPLPGETTLIAAGLYAGTTHKLSLIWLIVAAAAAAIIGDNIGYLIGRFGGYRLVRRYGKYVHVDEAKLKVGRYLFDRNGGKVVFVGRFVSVLRTYAAFLAGVNMMHWRRFLIYNAAGGICWAALVCCGAYYLGNAVHKVSSAVTYVGGGLAVVALVALVFYLRRHFKGLEEVAERAYPGPLDAHLPPGQRPAGSPSKEQA